MNAHAGSVTADEEVVNKSDNKGMHSIVSCDNRTFPLIAVPDSGFVELLLAPQSSDDVSFGCIMENVLHQTLQECEPYHKDGPATNL